MPGSQFIPNPGFEGALLRSTEVRDYLVEKTEEIAERYREGVPVDDGDLQEGVFTEVDLGPEGYRGRVGNRAWHAGLVELGSSNNGPDGSFRRAVEAAGFEPGEFGGL